jgi:hypothetical protein
MENEGEGKETRKRTSDTRITGAYYSRKKTDEFEEFKKKTIIQERNKYIRQHQNDLTFYREILRQLGASEEETYT